MITSLKIENFKSIVNGEFSFKSFTIFTGTNSSGKSSIIQSILFYSCVSQPNIHLESYLSSLGSVENLLYFKVTKDKKIKITLDVNGKELLPLTSNDTCDDWDNLDCNNFLAFERELFHLSSNRIGQQDITKTHKTLKSGNSGEHLFGFYEENKNKSIKNKELISNSDSNTLSSQVRFWLNKILDLKLEPITQKINSNDIEIQYNNYELGIKLSPFNIGAGVDYLTKILILGLSLEKDNLLIVENPEIHLHPKAITKLCDFFIFLVNAGIQVILETHSDHILNKTRWNVFKNNISNDSVKVYYRNSENEDFVDLNINKQGRFTDKDSQIIEFPTGFFDSDLDELLEMM